jgi:hypothetical protein
MSPTRRNGPGARPSPAHVALGPFTSYVCSWSNTMRFALALGLLIALCASAGAATIHHSKPRHHVSVRDAYGMAPSFAVAPRGYYSDVPSYNDPSKLGGQTPY